MPILPASPRQVIAVWRLLGVVAYGVEVRSPVVVNTASKLIRAVMADTGVAVPFDHEAHKAECTAKYAKMGNTGQMGAIDSKFKVLTEDPDPERVAELEAKHATLSLTAKEADELQAIANWEAAEPQRAAKRAPIEKRWSERIEGIVRIRKCYHDASYSDVPTVAPNVPNRFKMREMPLNAPSGPRCFYCNRPQGKGVKLIWARLAAIHVPMSPRPYRPMPPSAVCPNCVPALNVEIANRERKAVEQGRRAPNLIVYGYDEG